MSYQLDLSNSKITFKIKNELSQQIDLEKFKSIRNENDFSNCCDLFIHLKEKYKEKVENEFFYELAILINNNIENHSIDWVNTFAVIEKENYAKHLRKSDSNDDEECDVFDNIVEALEYNDEIDIEIEKKATRNSIIEGVTEILKEKKIINYR